MIAHPPFDRLQPSATIDVVPGQSIQAALDLVQPGTMVALHAGDYHECPKLDRSGTPDAPIWIKAIDGPRTARLFPGGQMRGATLSAFGERCIVIDGLDVAGRAADGRRVDNCIQFGLSGTDAARLDLYARSIVVRNSIAHDARMDNIKISQADDVWLLDNECRIAGDQNIDLMATNDAVIARNLLDQCSGPSSICIKGGSERVTIARCGIYGGRLDALSIGGFADLKWWRPGTEQWEARHVYAIRNDIRGHFKSAVLFMGAVECGIYDSYIGDGSRVPTPPSVYCRDDNNGLPSVDVECSLNTFQNKPLAFAPVKPGSNFAERFGNTFDGVWPRPLLVGPDSGPVVLL